MRSRAAHVEARREAAEPMDKHDQRPVRGLGQGPAKRRRQSIAGAVCELEKQPLMPKRCEPSPARNKEIAQRLKVAAPPRRARYEGRNAKIRRGCEPQPSLIHVSSCLLWWRCKSFEPGMAAKRAAVAWSVSPWNFTVQTNR